MTKTYLLIVVLLFPFLIKGQIVNIPDPAFKDQLVNHSPVIDTNSDGEIQVSEALAFDGVMNIEGVPGNPGSVSDLTGLEAFENLDELQCSYNQITFIDTSENALLRHLRCNENPLSNVDLSGSPILRTISFTGHQLTELDVSNNNDLLLLQCNFGGLTNLILGSQPDLQFLYVQDNQLSQLSVSGAPSLVVLIAEYNNLSQINVSNNPLLDYFTCRNNNFEYLDLSNNSNLRTLKCNENPQLTYINLRNGANEMLNISGTPPNSCIFEGLPELETVCVDELGSPLTVFIEDQVGHSVNFIEECLLDTDRQKLTQLRLYPVPTSRYIHIDSDVAIKKVEIYNLLGQRVQLDEATYEILSLNLSGLKRGVYLVKLWDEEYHETVRKIVLN